jgi:hypothetical protein
MWRLACPAFMFRHSPRHRRFGTTSRGRPLRRVGRSSRCWTAPPPGASR